MSKPFDKTKPFVARFRSYDKESYTDFPARLLASDFKEVNYQNMQETTETLIVAVAGLYRGNCDVESIYKFSANGGREDSTYGWLVNVPVKKTGWVNVYVNPTTRDVYTDKVNYTTEEWAKTNARAGWANATGLIVNTVKVEWEE